jgi:hypothetical protein
MPETRLRSNNPDKNQMFLDQIKLSVLCDMGIIGVEQYNYVIGSAPRQIDLLQSVKKLNDAQEKEFSGRFLDKIFGTRENLVEFEPLSSLTSVLAKAYVATKEILNDNSLSDQDREFYVRRLDNVTKHIDSLITDFADKIGYHFVDTTNVAGVYAGYKEMFDVRERDLEPDSFLANQIKYNREILESNIKEYDSVWDISYVDESGEALRYLQQNFDAAYKQAKGYTPSESTLTTASKYKFLDENGAEIAQFKDKEGNFVFDYQSGCVLDKNGRLAATIDLARHDFALHHINDKYVGTKTEQDVQSEIDEGVLYKLFEIDTAEKIVSGVMEEPQRFTDPIYFQDFINGLNAHGGAVSDAGYEAAMDAQADKTAGFAGRIKQKLGKFGSKAKGLFGKMFKPIMNIDKRAKDRFSGQSEQDREDLRTNFLLRFAKGFGSALLFSASLTTIATIATAATGLALAGASVGMAAVIGFASYQYYKWRKNRLKNGLDTSLSSLLKDKRMMMSYGVSLLATSSMVSGVAGAATLAMFLGFGALTLGAGNNSVFTYKDARNSGMSKSESAFWSVASALGVLGGGFFGRIIGSVAGQTFVDNYNAAHQDYVKIGEHTDTEYVYKQSALENAERICKMWYKDDPDLLQQRVDLIKAYNASHGTSIDPYRAIMINADAGGLTADNMALHVDGGGVVYSHGHHTVLTEQWAKDNGYSMDEVNTVRHMFDDGRISDAEITGASHIDKNISIINEVGAVTAGDAPHYDGVLPQNTVDANGVPVFNTYANGELPYDVKTTVVDDFGWVNGTDAFAVDVYGTIGNYSPKHVSELKERPGALADKIVIPEQNEEIITIIGPDQVPVIEPAPDPIIEPVEDDILPVVQPAAKYLRITFEQANALNYGSAAEVEKLCKELGIKSNEEMWDAQYWAYRKHDLVKAKETLESISDPDKAAKLKAKIAEYESELPDESEFYDHAYLKVTPAQAHAFDANTDYNIPRTDDHLNNPKLKGSKRSEQKSKSKKHSQTVRRVMNELGVPSPSVLHEGLYWEYRKELEDVLNNHDLHMPKSEKQKKIEHLKQKIAFWYEQMTGSRSEIPDESLFVDPVAVQYDPESGEKVEKFKIAQKKIQVLQAKGTVANAIDAAEHSIQK